MSTRLSKIALVFAIAGFMALVVFGNVTDYRTNFAFVTHVLKMDTIFPDSGVKWRAIHAPTLHHAFYVGIIAWEALTAALCCLGGVRLWRARHAEPAAFQRAKGLATAGLTCGLLLWFGGFIALGGEWFSMWQSNTWNGLAPATRLFTCFGIVLLFLTHRNDELAPG